jgi:16S rRNA (guanine(966)-N(2))-methyltransferase RsmD
VRITGGFYRSRVINAPANLPVRPTTDFAKSALFNILNNYDFEKLNVLDLFAGAGSISYEFISRGALNVICVDEDYHCVQFIKKTANDLKMTNLKCIRSDVFRYVRQEHTKWDIIFADPPFVLEQTDLLPDLVFQNKILNDKGWLIIEHQSKRQLHCQAKPFDRRKYGNCTFTMFRMLENT